MNICPKCGLPLQACVCEGIAKTEQRIQIRIEKKRFGKVVTVISGIQDMDLKSIAKGLKHELACGGTVKGDRVELQGDHSRNVKAALTRLGFPAESIEAWKAIKQRVEITHLEVKVETKISKSENGRTKKWKKNSSCN